MQSLVVALEKSEKEVEAKTNELNSSLELIEKLRVEVENLRSSTFSMAKSQEAQAPLPPRKRDRLINRIASLRGEVSRISDYLARAQQLITLLVGQDRMNPQVKEAMRRVDWERVVKSYPTLLDHTHLHFENIIEALNKYDDDDSMVEFEESQAQVNLSEVLDSALKKVARGQDLQINKLYFYNDEIPMFKQEMESVFYKVLRKSVESMEPDSIRSLRIVTRPRGRHAEIEISDTGTGIDKEQFLRSKDGESIEGALKRHHGKFQLLSHKGSGSTFTIDLPTFSSTL